MYSTMNSKQRITLLDLGGVVFQSTGRSNDRIDWSTISQLNYKYGHALNIGEDQFPTFMREYNKLTDQDLSGELFLKLVFDTLKINTELIKFLRKDSNIIIVSDNYRENIEYISGRYAFDEWAIHQIYSFDYKMVKADLGFFPRLLEELSDYQKEDMLFIDDSIEKIASAAKSGIKGILFNNNPQVFTEIGHLKS